MRAECSGDGGGVCAGPARASVCIRHIYHDSGRAGSMTRPNARPAYVGRRRTRRGPFHYRTPMQKANTLRQVGTHAFLIIYHIRPRVHWERRRFFMSPIETSKARRIPADVRNTGCGGTETSAGGPSLDRTGPYRSRVYFRLATGRDNRLKMYNELKQPRDQSIPDNNE